MLRSRIIPTLLLKNESLVKTVGFDNFIYVGDPANTVRIFNELEVDELFFLDIDASRKDKKPNLKVLREISDECFMPLGYGGGISNIEIAKSIFDIGFEKIVLNSHAVSNPKLISEIAKIYGTQALVVAIDVKANLFGKKTVRTFSGKINTKIDPVIWAKNVEQLGAGELLITSIDKEGSWSGFDFDLISNITRVVNIPVIAHGGCGSINHMIQVVKLSKASAVALGSLVVFQKKGRGVLINYPNKDLLDSI
jgi:cyclase